MDTRNSRSSTGADAGAEEKLAEQARLYRPSELAIFALDRLLHSGSGWVVRIRGGLPEFVPPKWIDSTQTARRKPPPPSTAE